MKHYKMATVSNPSITKQPLKTLEIPLNKFTEEVLPHHQRNLEKHKEIIHKLIVLNDEKQLLREIKDKKRSVKQLRDLLYELDTLRTQVEDKDLDSFDNKTMSLRTSILKLTTVYKDLEKAAERVILASQTLEESQTERVNPFEGVSQLQLHANLDDLKLKQEQDRLNRVEEIQRNSEGLRDIYRDLHEMVQGQGESVAEVEENITSARENVSRGFRDIIKSHKLTSVTYPATGAVLGSLVGGPIGFLAGMKIGGVAAIGCAIVGYASGKFLKNKKDEVVVESEAVINNENNENHTASESLKKDI